MKLIARASCIYAVALALLWSLERHQAVTPTCWHHLQVPSQTKVRLKSLHRRTSSEPTPVDSWHLANNAEWAGA